MKLRKKLRYLYYRAVRSHGEPRQVAMGMAIGVAVSLTPTPGHTPLAIAVAALTGQSKLAAAVGVWVNNPVTMPIVYPGAYALGAWLLGRPLHLPGGFLKAITSFSSLASGLLLPAWLGCAVLAVPLGAATYWLTYQGVVAYRLKARARRASLPHRWHWNEERGWHRLSRHANAAEGQERARDAH
jgi:hypothetical protein